MPIAATPPPTPIHLLDLEPALGARLREDDRAEARERLLLPVVAVPEGEWSLVAHDHRMHPFGLVVVDGLLLREVQLGGRRSDQLLGRGDVVIPRPTSDGSLSYDLRLIAAIPSRVALLDDRLQAPFAMWPGLALGLIAHVGDQLARGAAHAAIAQLPRVEDRLEATFWDLADRWGRVTQAGIHIPLRLTHETLARVVGGRRPTISLALAQLAERGILERRADGSWLLTARAPTLPRDDGDGDGAGPPPLSWSLPASGPPPEPASARRAWAGAARAELLETTRRVRAEHHAVAQRVRADGERYAATRRRSQELREQAERARADRLRTPARPAP
jgi:CRP/FNR family transcriptional regulator, cyclic AMP receptor protein